MKSLQILHADDPFEARKSVPLCDLKAWEEKGFVPDGTAYTEDGERRVDVHRSAVFDGCAALGFPGAGSAGVLAKSLLTLPEVKKATLRVTALGFYEPYFNGEALTDAHLMPATSDYWAHDFATASYPIYDEMSHRIYYQTYDVTPLVKAGENALAFHIGMGWLDTRNRAESMPDFGEMMLVFRLTVETAGGETQEYCSSAENTRWKKSYITDSSLYYGETHDYALFDQMWETAAFDGSWEPCEEKPAPLTYFAPTFFPGDAEDGTIAPECVLKEGDVALYDLHSIPAGFAVIRPTAEGRVFVEYGDRYELDDAGSPVFILRHTGGDHRRQSDTCLFTAREVGKDFHVRFTWHASRYIKVTGKAEIPVFVKVNSPLEQRLTFKTGKEIPDWIFSAFVDTVRANLHGFIPSDCPHRERLGYTGDGQLTSHALMRVFDAKTMYRKWMRDILDCQDIEGGHVQHTAPFRGGGGGPGGWGGAICIVPWNYYEVYGDDTLLRQSYRGMKAYIGYMLDHRDDGIVTREEPKGWCLGDWCTPHNDIKIPPAFVNTYFLIRCLNICGKTAKLFGKTEDAEEFAAWENETRNAFVKAFFDPETQSFCAGTQGADAFAVELGLGTEQTKRNLIEKYTALGTFDTGIFGTDILLRVLINLGERDLAKRLFENKEETSFYNMMLGGTNTLWENWEGCDSLCHPMFGAVVDSLLELY